MTVVIEVSPLPENRAPITVAGASKQEVEDNLSVYLEAHGHDPTEVDATVI